MAAVLAVAAFAMAASSGAAQQSTAQDDLATVIRSLGDPEQGRQLILTIGCGSCHEIPGILGADGLVGPPLDRMGRRQYIAGLLRNTPDALVRWIRFPQQVLPGNAMPDMGISEEDARQIAAYLYTLQ